MRQLASTGPERNERGIALITSLLMLLPVASLVIAAILHSKTAAERFRDDGFSQRANSALASAMEVAKVAVAAGTYTDPTYPDRNEVLAAAADQVDNASLWARTQAGATQARVLDIGTNRRSWVATTDLATLPADQIPFRRLLQVDLGLDAATVYIAPVGPDWYLLECAVTVADVTRTGTVMVRDRDPFSRFNVFCDQGDQPVSVRITGDIHANTPLRFMYGGWDLPGYVSAVSGFTWTYGADWTNVQFGGGYDDAATPIAMPDLADIQSRAHPPAADPAAWEIAGDYIYVGTDYTDVQVEFAGSNLTVTAVDPSSVTVTIHNGPIGSTRRVYAKNAITSLHGDLDGRLSIFTESADGITIEGNVRYIDSDGDLATTDPTGQNPHQRNPDYDGDSALGLLAPNGYVTYGFSTPSVLEVHAAVLTGLAMTPPTIRIDASGNPYTDFSVPFLRDEIITLGSCITKYGKFRGTVDGYGNKTSGYDQGVYLYDRGLLDSPPPYFVDIARPHFKGFWIHESFLDV